MFAAERKIFLLIKISKFCSHHWADFMHQFSLSSALSLSFLSSSSSHKSLIGGWTPFTLLTRASEQDPHSSALQDSSHCELPEPNQSWEFSEIQLSSSHYHSGFKPRIATQMQLSYILWSFSIIWTFFLPPIHHLHSLETGAICLARGLP